MILQKLPAWGKLILQLWPKMLSTNQTDSVIINISGRNQLISCMDTTITES